MSKDLSIQAVRFGQPASGLGEVTHMARVDHRYRDISRCKLSRHWKLQSPCSLQYYQSRLQRLQLGDQPADTLLVIAHSPMRFTWLNGYVQLLLRYVYAHVGLLCAHPRFTPSRPVLADSGLYGPGNCSGSGRLVGVTILLGYGLHYQDPFDLSRPSVQDTRSLEFLGMTEKRALRLCHSNGGPPTRNLAGVGPPCLGMQPKDHPPRHIPRVHRDDRNEQSGADPTCSMHWAL